MRNIIDSLKADPERMVVNTVIPEKVVKLSDVENLLSKRHPLGQPDNMPNMWFEYSALSDVIPRSIGQTLSPELLGRMEKAYLKIAKEVRDSMEFAAFVSIVFLAIVLQANSEKQAAHEEPEAGDILGNSKQLPLPVQERGDSVCKEDDGCPTERAVLQRFWRETQTDIGEMREGALSQYVEGRSTEYWKGYGKACQDILNNIKEKNT